MDDDQFAAWLMFVTRELANLRKKPRDNRGPRFDDTNTITTDDEGFLRWMGWRGEVEQERELRQVSADDLKEERLKRSYRKVWEENRDLKALLRFIRDEIQKKIGSGS